MDSASDEINLKEIFTILWKKKLTIFSISTFFAVCSVLYALSLPNIYSSKVLLLPSNSQDAMSSKLGSLSSLGSLAGVSIPVDQTSKSKEGIERIKSFDFFANFFMPNIQLENLMAVKKWDAENNSIVYDNKIYKNDTQTWIGSSKYSEKNQPSLQEAYRVYKENITVNENSRTSFISMSVNHKSPIIAQKWLNIIIEQINKSMREADKMLAKKSIEYLNEAQNTTSIQSIKEVTSKLLENQMQTLMLASSTDSYVFKIIDPPIVPEYKSSPSRSIIVIFSTFFGAFLSLIFIFIQHNRER